MFENLTLGLFVFGLGIVLVIIVFVFFLYFLKYLHYAIERIEKTSGNGGIGGVGGVSALSGGIAVESGETDGKIIAAITGAIMMYYAETGQNDTEFVVRKIKRIQ